MRIIIYILASVMILVMALTGCRAADPIEPGGPDGESAADGEQIAALESTENISAQWKLSEKKFMDPFPAGRGPEEGNCRLCHDGYAFSNQKMEDLPDELPHVTGIDCQACHTDFGKETLDSGSVDLTNQNLGYIDLVEAGTGSMCFACHHGRRNPEVAYEEKVSGEMNRFTYPHYGPAAVLTGEGGMELAEYEYSSTTAHVNIENSCVGCHMPDTDNGYAAHTFYMDEAYLEQSCATCHSGIDTFNLNGVQDEVKAMKDQLYEAILDDTGATEVTTAGGQFIFEIADGSTLEVEEVSDEAYLAAYNWYLVKGDGSLGVHNPAYAKSLLRNSYENLTGEEM